MLKTKAYSKTRSDYVKILNLLKDYGVEIEEMWEQIIKEVHSSKPVGQERLDEIAYKRDKIIQESVPYIEVIKIKEMIPKKFMDISKLVTKSWEGTVKGFEEKGISQLELLEDKLS